MVGDVQVILSPRESRAVPDPRAHRVLASVSRVAVLEVLRTTGRSAASTSDQGLQSLATRSISGQGRHAI